jgi:hypothetical protein
MIVDLPPPDHLSGLDGEAYVAQHRAAFVIGKSHILEDDFPANRLLQCIRLFREDGIRIENRPHAFHGYRSLGNGVVHAGEVFHRLEK